MKKVLDKKYQPIIYFKTQEDWRNWLSKNHDKSEGIWLKFYKKNSGVATITYDQALDEALCFGWIDGQAKSLDEKSYLQRFTPRRPKSIWSKRNTEHIARLAKLGKMKPSGLKTVESAKKDGRWQGAYESPQNMPVPEDFLKELAKNKVAFDYFKTLNKTNIFAVVFQLYSAKRPETRKRRMKKFIGMFSRGEKLY